MMVIEPQAVSKALSSSHHREVGESATLVKRPSLRCLWIARELPFPMNTGDRIYTAQLAKSLADAGAKVSFIGLEADVSSMPHDWPIDWHPVRGKKRSYWRALVSTAPLVVAAHDTLPFRIQLDVLLEEAWDAIIIDHYGCGFVLDRIKRHRELHHEVVVHIAQNHEERLAQSLYRSAAAGPLKRAYLYQNFLKTRQIERRLVRAVDLVSAITTEDRVTLALQADGTRFVVLTPGYSGEIARRRRISAATPRHVVLIGSYRWVVKHENLRMLLHAADQRFHEQGIILDVIGDVPEQIRCEFSNRLKATRFHGFVADPSPLIEGARMALVPEVIGGGFKLKFLDYIFNRLPIATIKAAAAGLPSEIKAHLLLAIDLNDLITQVISHIDRTDLLQQLQERALGAAGQQFDWRDRGLSLRNEIERLQREGRARRTL